MNRPFLPSRRSGFTLVELLVVIAIIGLLAAILFPVFGRARENARRSVCLSNLKQIGLGLMQYVQDYDEYYPYGNFGCSTCTSSQGESWRLAIYSYVKSKQVFVCPSNPNNKSAARYDGTSPNAELQAMFPDLPSFRVSYAANAFFANSLGTQPPLGGANGDPAHKLSAMASPSTLYLAGESLSIYDYVRVDQTATSAGSDQPWTFGHMQTTNVLFADGHAKVMKWAQTCISPYSWRMDGGACNATLNSHLLSYDDYYSNS